MIYIYMAMVLAFGTDGAQIVGSDKSQQSYETMEACYDYVDQVMAATDAVYVEEAGFYYIQLPNDVTMIASCVDESTIGVTE